MDVEFVWYPVWSPDRMSDAAKKYLVMKEGLIKGVVMDIWYQIGIL